MKISIIGDVFIVTSALTVEDIQLAAKHKPDALKVFDKDGVEKFAVSYNEGRSCIAGFAITFGGKTRNKKGYATLTSSIPKGEKNVKEYVADKLGAGAAYLEQIEESLPTVINEISEKHNALLGNINVLDGDDDEDENDGDGIEDDDEDIGSDNEDDGDEYDDSDDEDGDDE